MLRLMLALALAIHVSTARAADPGARIYAERCSGCHGDDGRGDGPAAAALVPKPTDFRAPAFWHDHTREGVRATVVKGKVGTMMAPFAGVLTDGEIDAVVDYLHHFAPAPPAGAPPASGSP